MNEPECNEEDDYEHDYQFSEDDSRTEWYEYKEACSKCGTIKTRRTEYDQNGLVESDAYYYEKNGIIYE